MRYQLVGLVDRAATTTNVLSETRYTVCATRTVVSSLLNRLPRTDRRRWWRGGPSSPPVSPPPPPPLPPPTDRSLPPPTDRRTRPIVADRRRFVTLSRRVNTRSSPRWIDENTRYGCVARRGDGDKNPLHSLRLTSPSQSSQSYLVVFHHTSKRKKIHIKRF